MRTADLVVSYNSEKNAIVTKQIEPQMWTADLVVTYTSEKCHCNLTVWVIVMHSFIISKFLYAILWEDNL